MVLTCRVVSGVTFPEDPPVPGVGDSVEIRRKAFGAVHLKFQPVVGGERDGQEDDGDGPQNSGTHQHHGPTGASPHRVYLLYSTNTHTDKKRPSGSKQKTGQGPATRCWMERAHWLWRKSIYCLFADQFTLGACKSSGPMISHNGGLLIRTPSPRRWILTGGDIEERTQQMGSFLESGFKNHDKILCPVKIYGKCLGK